MAQGGTPRPPNIAALVVLVLLGFTVILVLISFPLGWYAVFSGALSNKTDYSTAVRPYLFIGPVAAYLPFRTSVGVLFATLSVVYMGMLVLSARQERRPLSAAADSLRGGGQALLSSPLFAAMIFFGFVVFSTIIIDDLVTSAKVPIGGIGGDTLLFFVGLNTSPLVEEIGFRVILIGVVAMILCIGRPATALKALWRPSAAIEGFAPRSGPSVLIWVATGFSALAFGASHIFNGGWEIGKLPSAALAGLVLGYVYVKYGFHIAVLVHWGVDYFALTYAFFGQAAYGIPWDSSSVEFFGQYLVDYDLLFLFGLASFLLVLYVALRRMLTRSRSPLEVDKGQTPEPLLVP